MRQQQRSSKRCKAEGGAEEEKMKRSWAETNSLCQHLQGVQKDFWRILFFFYSLSFQDNWAHLSMSVQNKQFTHKEIEKSEEAAAQKERNGSICGLSYFTTRY